MLSPPDAPHTIITRTHEGRRRAFKRMARRSYLLLLAAAVLLCAAPAAAHTLPGLLGSAAVASFVALWLAGVATGTSSSRFGVARLEGDTLRMFGHGFEHVLPITSLREGYARLGALGWSVKVRDDAGVVYEFGVASEGEATGWLDALGLDASRRAMRVVSDRTITQWAFAYLFGGFFALPIMTLMLGVLALLGADPTRAPGLTLAYLGLLPGYWLAARSVGRVDVSVGADGVRAGRGFRRRFFPVDALEGAQVRGATMRLRLASGRAASYRFERAEDALAVARRVEEVLALHRSAPQGLPAALATAGARTADEWRALFLDALREEGYRAVAFTLDDLTRLLHAKNLTAPQRLGAALALRELAPEQGRTGVRVAVEAMVDPPPELAASRDDHSDARVASARRT